MELLNNQFKTRALRFGQQREAAYFTPDERGKTRRKIYFALLLLFPSEHSKRFAVHFSPRGYNREAAEKRGERRRPADFPSAFVISNAISLIDSYRGFGFQIEN